MTVVENVLGHYKVPNYKETVHNMLGRLKDLKSKYEHRITLSPTVI